MIMKEYAPGRAAGFQSQSTGFESWYSCLMLGRPVGFILCSMTLEPDGTATGCNPVEVGSTPTGVFQPTV